MLEKSGLGLIQRISRILKERDTQMPISTVNIALTGSILLLMTSLGAAGEIIDLTYSFSEETVYWPTGDEFSLRVDAEGMTEKGYYYTANSFSTAEHGGTHMDAPLHFAEGMPSIEEVSLNRLVAPAVLIDVEKKTVDDNDYLITVEDFVSWERRHGVIRDGHIILLRTGWGKYYPDKELYLGTAERGPAAVSKLSFPGLDPRAAEWLVKNREVAAIGLDTASIDRGKSEFFKAHRILFAAGIPVFENVANLDQLPETGFRVIALPMKIKGGSGAPLRIVAILD
jgi:kynurenine formamidase